MSSTIQNARAIEAALQRLQGPPARGKLLVKATGADVVLTPGTCASPILGNSIDRLGTAFVRPNPANPAEDLAERTWTVTSSGLLVDVEAVSGGTPGNREGGTSYRWDPPELGLEPLAVADAAGVTGGDWAGVYGGLKQFTHFSAVDFDPRQDLFETITFDYPAALLAWAGSGPADGPMAGTPGPRTARLRQTRMFYRNRWALYLVTSRLDGNADRAHEATLLRDDVLECLENTMAVRERAFRVSAEPGADITAASPFRMLPQVYVDLILFDTFFVLEHRPETRTYNDWLRTRVKLYTAPNPGIPPQDDAPPLELPNLVVPMPPNGPGTPPFPDEPPPS